MPPGAEVVLTSAELRKMSHAQVLRTLADLGISTAGLEGRTSAALTKLISHAHSAV